MGARGPARGGRGGGADTPGVVVRLGRGEMEQAGVPAPELPFFRDWARTHVNGARYYELNEPLARLHVLIQYAERWAKELLERNKERGEKALASVQVAKVHLERQLNRFRQRQARRLPKDAPTLAPTTFEQELEIEPPRAQRRRGKGAQGPQDGVNGRLPHPGGTEGEERYDPKWGDPNQELPPARPVGMTRLPDHDTEIPERGPKRGKKR